MSEFVFVKNEQQAVCACDATRNAEVEIIPIMPQAAITLRERGFENARLPVDYLNISERNAVFLDSYKLSKQYLNFLGEKLKYKGVDVTECFRLQMLAFLQDVLTSDLFVRKFIKEKSPTKCFFYNNSNIPSLSAHMHDGCSDVLPAVLQWEFKKAHVEIEFLKDVDVLNELECKTISSKPNDFCTKHLQKRISIKDIPNNRKLVLGFGVDYDLFVIWPYIKALSKELDALPILISDSKEIYQTSNRSGLDCLDYEFSYIFVGDLFDKNRQESKEFILEAKSILGATTLFESMTAPQLKNPLLSFQFKALCELCLPQIVKHIDISYDFLSSHNVGVFVDDYCAGESNRAWHQVCKKHNITSITVSHGALNLVEFYDFLGNFSFVQGELGKDVLGEFLIDKSNNIIAVGDPAMQKVSESSSFKQLNQKSDVILAPDAENTKSEKTLILMTAGFLHQAWSDIDLDKFFNTWSEVYKIAKNRPSWRFIIKPHPSKRDLPLWYEKFFLSKEQKVDNVQVVVNVKLEELLKKYTKNPTHISARSSCNCCGVLVGKPSTAGLVCILNSMPVAYLDSMLCRDVFGYKIWNEKNGMPTINSANGLEHWAEKIFTDDDFLKQTLSSNDYFRHKYEKTFDEKETARAIFS